MKFVLTYTFRDGGSLAEREADVKRSMKLLDKFQPSVQISEWVDRIDGDGGFAVLESDDPQAMARDLAIWAPFLRFQLYPVVDVADGNAAINQGIEFRESIS